MSARYLMMDFRPPRRRNLSLLPPPPLLDLDEFGLLVEANPFVRDAAGLLEPRNRLLRSLRALTVEKLHLWLELLAGGILIPKFLIVETHEHGGSPKGWSATEVPSPLPGYLSGRAGIPTEITTEFLPACRSGKKA